MVASLRMALACLLEFSGGWDNGKLVAGRAKTQLFDLVSGKRGMVQELPQIFLGGPCVLDVSGSHARLSQH
jgi:hypothetical protein